MSNLTKEKEVIIRPNLPGVRTCEVCGRRGPGIFCYRKPWEQQPLKYSARGYFHLPCFNAEKNRRGK